MTYSQEALAKPEEKQKRKVCLSAFVAETIAQNARRNCKMKEKLIVNRLPKLSTKYAGLV